jgi:hypothetical protein
MPSTRPSSAPRAALLALLLVGGSCGSDPSGPAAGDATEVLRTFPVADLERSLSAAVPHAAIRSNRRNIRIAPPGHWFATWMVECNVPDDQVDARLCEVFEAAERRLTAAGGALRTPGERRGQPRHEGMAYAILGVPPRPGAEAPRVLEGEYTVADRHGWVTAMAMPSAREGYWRIGCALHEP